MTVQETSDLDVHPSAELALQLRESLLPLPTRADGYRRVLLVGTTGSGKTTLVRQLIGTDPDRERFPSVSTAKTTTADTEIITGTSGPYAGVVTFASLAEVRAALEDCIVEALLAALDQRGDRDVLRRLLDHPEQRFRFSYVLGRGRPVDEGEESALGGSPDVQPVDDIDQGATDQLLSDIVEQLKSFAATVDRDVRQDLTETDDPEAFKELLQEEVERRARDSREVSKIVDSLIDEIDLRFHLLSKGEITWGADEWPIHWAWQTDDRAQFLGEIARFSSNYAPRFGRLLTPLVNGIRVSGPFQPQWSSTSRSIALIDVEGLGHTPDSNTAVSLRLLERFDDVDAIVLVDNGAQPMQGAAVAAIRAIVTSGYVDKLLVAFTHLDQVTGDNLPTLRDREEHILASAENVARFLAEEIGTFDEQRLRQRIENASVFLSELHRPLDLEDPVGRRTALALNRLADAVESAGGPVDMGEARPYYERERFVSAITAAVTRFHRRWRGLLGRDLGSNVRKEHWTRIKALSRRFAEGFADEYDNLRPVADLAMQLREEIYRVIKEPSGWRPRRPDTATEDEILDGFANAVSTAVIEISRRRIWPEHKRDWVNAFAESGRGSSFVRARIIAEEIYAPAAPPNEGSELADEVAAVLVKAADDFGIVLR